MTDKAAYVTQEGLQKLQDELDELVTIKRKEVVQRIKVAREHGDLSENSEYDSAKEEQAFVESRIAQIEKKIRNATLIDPSQEKDGVVAIGKTVSFKELPDGEKEEFMIVGSTESDPLSGKISNDSPLATALIGKRLGDKVSIQTPGGEMKVEIIEVR